MQINVLPSQFKVCFDVRVAHDVEHSELEAEIRRWCSEAGSDVCLEFKTQNPKMGKTVLDASNPWWTAFKAECDKMYVNKSYCKSKKREFSEFDYKNNVRQKLEGKC